MTMLVLLPGLDGTGTLFTGFVEALGEEIESIVVRYPSDVCLSYSELVAFVSDKLPVDQPFVLLGESFSGPIAIQIAAQRPNGLAGVVLCATFATSPVTGTSVLAFLSSLVSPTFVPAWALSLALLGRWSKPELLDQVQQAVSGVQSSVLGGRVQEIGRIDVTSILNTIEVPVLYMQAKNDRLVGSSSFHKICTALPSIEHVVLDGPHCLLQACPNEAAAAVLPFVRRSALAL